MSNVITNQELEVLMVEGFDLISENSGFEDFSVFTESATVLAEAVESALFVGLTEAEGSSVVNKAKAFISGVGSSIKKADNRKLAAIVASAMAVGTALVTVVVKKKKKGQVAEEGCDDTASGFDWLNEEEDSEAGAEGLLSKIGGILTAACSKAKNSALSAKVAAFAKTIAGKLKSAGSSLSAKFSALAAKVKGGKEETASGADLFEGLDSAIEEDLEDLNEAAIDAELESLIIESELDEIDADLNSLMEDTEVEEDAELDEIDSIMEQLNESDQHIDTAWNF